MKKKPVLARIYRACLGCPGPHSMMMPPSVAERLADLSCGVSCSSDKCTARAKCAEFQAYVDARHELPTINTQEKLDEVLGIEQAAPEPKAPLTLLELMEA